MVRMSPTMEDARRKRDCVESAMSCMYSCGRMTAVMERDRIAGPLKS